MSKQDAKTEHPEQLASGCFSAPADRASPLPVWLRVLEATIGSLNLLGLDAVLVGLCWQDAAARQWNVPLFVYQRFLLAAAIWLSYIADRAWDVRRYRKIRPEGLPERHAFLWRYRNAVCVSFLAIAVTAVCVAIVSCGYDEWRNGLSLASVAIGYMVFAQRFPRIGRLVLPREITVAVLFLAGSVLFPFTAKQTPFQSNDITWLIWGSVLLWANAYGISVWEQKIDEQLDEPTAISQTRYAESRYRWFLRVIIFIALLRCYLNPSLSSITLAVALGAMLLSIVDRLRKTWIKPALADLSVLTPWLF